MLPRVQVAQIGWLHSWNSQNWNRTTRAVSPIMRELTMHTADPLIIKSSPGTMPNCTCNLHTQTIDHLRYVILYWQIATWTLTLPALCPLSSMSPFLLEVTCRVCASARHTRARTVTFGSACGILCRQAPRSWGHHLAVDRWTEAHLSSSGSGGPCMKPNGRPPGSQFRPHVLFVHIPFLVWSQWRLLLGSERQRNCSSLAFDFVFVCKLRTVARWPFLNKTGRRFHCYVAWNCFWGVNELDLVDPLCTDWLHRRDDFLIVNHQIEMSICHKDLAPPASSSVNMSFIY
jgi:hypothetical protein